MKHLYTNRIAAVDVETTGTIANYHEILQLAIVPLDSQLKPQSPFVLRMQPNHPERLDPNALAINGLDINTGVSQERGIDLLTEWFEALDLPQGGRIIPLAHNRIFERDFLKAWLGPEEMDRIFHHHGRDAMLVALALKDKSALLGQPIPFDSVSLENLCKYYGVVNQKAHDALSDCLAEAELYRRILGAKD